MVGNAPFDLVKRHDVSIFAYSIFRSVNNTVHDSRVEREADATSKHLDESVEVRRRNAGIMEKNMGQSS